MAYCLRHGESPFWDPYTATGALGPETLADIKFSPLSLITALLGGSSRALTFVLLAVYGMSAYCLIRVLSNQLEVSLLSAVAAVFVYFLNGFTLTNLYTAVSQPYFLAPLLLLAMVSYTRAASLQNTIGVIGAHVLFLATTFTPTAVLCGIFVYAITFALRISENPRRIRQLTLTVAPIPIVALAVLSFLYAPTFYAFATYLATFSQYNSRRTPGVSLINLLSLFTPKHFWESYAGMQIPRVGPVSKYWPFVHHFGIVGPLLAAHAFFRPRRYTAAVIWVAFGCVLTATGQIFGIFPFTLIDLLPFFSFVYNEYWSCLLALGLVVLVAYGMEAISRQNAFGMPAAFVSTIIISSYFFLLGVLGFPQDGWPAKYLIIFWGILVSAVVLLAAGRVPALTSAIKFLLALLLVAEGIFYMNGLRPYRSGKDQHLSATLRWLQTNVQSRPGSRILNIGASGIFPNWGSGLQIPQLGDLNTAELPWYSAFFNKYIGQGMFMSLGGTATDKYLFSDDSLSLAGVRYVVVDRSIQPAIARLESLKYRIVQQDPLRLIYENPHPLPRAYVVPELWNVDGLPSDFGGNQKGEAASTDPSLISVATQLGIAVRAPHGKTTRPVRDNGGDVRIVEYHHDRILMRSNLREPGIVVVSDSWNPGWYVKIDGRYTPIGKVDVTFRGIAVPVGAHEISMFYAPRSLLVGKLVSLVTIVGLGLFFWKWKRDGESPLTVWARTDNRLFSPSKLWIGELATGAARGHLTRLSGYLLAKASHPAATFRCWLGGKL